MNKIKQKKEYELEGKVFEISQLKEKGREERKEGLQRNNLMIHLKDLEKQTKLKISRGK
jgi:hypothetical protein